MKSLHSGGWLSLPLPPFSFTPIERLTDGFCSRWRKNISGDGGKNWFFTERWGSNKGLGEAPKSYTRKECESATNSIAKRGQGGDFVPFRLPLAGSRDSVPCGVWGNAPTVPRATIILNALNKGAGSEASLPLTLRVRRRAPKLLPSQASVKNQIIRLSEQIGNDMKSCHFFLRALRPGVFIYEKNRKMIAKYGKNT